MAALWWGKKTTNLMIARVLFLVVHLPLTSSFDWNKESSSSLTNRRAYLKNILVSSSGGMLSGLIASPPVVVASSNGSGIEKNVQATNTQPELPLQLRPFTKLAPLGKAEVGSGIPKTKNLSLTEIAKRLEHSILYGATGKGGYFLTGDVPEEIFRDDCLFVDPTNSVRSLSQYRKALSILFDPNSSYVKIVQGSVIDEKERTISVKIRSRGFIQFFWKPYITSYESQIVYSVDLDGLISRQSQTWSKSAYKALQESFTPTFNTPPPRSTRDRPVNEPAEATQLFEIVNGRRPYEYSQEERLEIQQLSSQLLLLTSSGRSTWKPEQLLGEWMLVYLENGGIDRRIPFPEFNFNDSFQVFGNNNIVTNIGQLLGPWLNVQVEGVYREEDSERIRFPKRFRANIDHGNLCTSRNCFLPLPIQGEGIFDLLYLNDRIRLLRNINGSGARGIQVKL